MNRYLGYLYTFIFFLFLVDGAMPQMQILLFSGSVPVPGIVLKITLLSLLVFILLIHIFKTGTILWPTGIVAAYVIFAAYLPVHFLLSVEEYPPGYLLFSYNSYYFFLLVLPLAAYISVRAELVSKWFLIISVPIIALGMVQYLTNSPILPISSADQSFRVYSTEYYGKTRAFSLFNSGLNYGHFLSIAGALCTARLVQGKKQGRLINLAFLAVVIFACYTTLTRNLYIEFVFTVCSALLFSLQGKRDSPRKISRYIRYLPIFYGVAALFLVTITQSITFYLGGTSQLLRQESLIQRYLAWKLYFPLWTGQGIKTLLFGVGLIQNERFPVTEEVLLDNTFLAIGLHIGLAGLVLWFILMWALWKRLLSIGLRMPDKAILIAFLSLWSTWISSGIYCINFVLYAALATIVLSISRTETRPEQRTIEPAGSRMVVPGN